MIFDSYAVYAVCTKCGMHDWSYDTDDLGGVDYLKKKCPKHGIVATNEEMRKEAIT